MPTIIGVKFRNVGKVYYFDPVDFKIRYHDHVIVETARGVEYGTVVLSPTEIAEEKVTAPLKPVIRMATEEDTVREKENREKEKEAYRICKQKIAEHELDMKLIEAEYTFDNSKVLFYFTADGRIDFRDLVKDLASIFRTRIELRQIGVRDETKLLGGIGTCGRPLCCHTWLNEFAPVSIKMAKDQNLSLNPTKISGTCGRLMCCLKNEADTYAYLNKGLPGKGDYVTTPDGLHGDVQSVNILRQTVRVIVEVGDDEKELQEFDVKDITFIPKSKKPKHECPCQARARDEAKKNESKGGKNRRSEQPLPAELPAEQADGQMSGEETAKEGQKEGGRRRRRGQKQHDGETNRQDAENKNRSQADRSENAVSEGGDNADNQRSGEGGSSRRRSRRNRNKGENDAAKRNQGEAPVKNQPENGSGAAPEAKAGGAEGEGAPEGEHKKRRRRRRHRGPKPDGAQGGDGNRGQEIAYGSNEGE